MHISIFVHLHINMNNPRLAGRYSKSLIDLAIGQNQLDVIYNDIKFLKAVFKSNPDFVALLDSPIIKADKKEKIVAAVINGKVNKLTDSFIQLLIRKGRETNLPEIADTFIDQFNAIKGIRKVKITTATAISDAAKKSIVEKANAASGVNSIELETVVKEELIGGFILETENRLVDASISRDLREVKRQFLKKDYTSSLK